EARRRGAAVPQEAERVRPRRQHLLPRRGRRGAAPGGDALAGYGLRILRFRLPPLGPLLSAQHRRVSGYGDPVGRRAESAPARHLLAHVGPDGPRLIPRRTSTAAPGGPCPSVRARILHVRIASRRRWPLVGTRQTRGRQGWTLAAARCPIWPVGRDRWAGGER